MVFLFSIIKSISISMFLLLISMKSAVLIMNLPFKIKLSVSIIK